MPGLSVGHFSATAGTLGGFVRDAKGQLGILSNNHVLGGTNTAKKGDASLQPGSADGGRSPADRVGGFERLVKLKPSANAVDAAWATVDEGIQDIDASYEGKKLQDVLSADEITTNLHVWKIGQTTGSTRGIVSAIELDNVGVDFGTAMHSFDAQIEITGEDGPFSLGGDSGSFILDAANRGLGLLFAGSKTGGPNGSGRTYASPLETALSLLGPMPVK